MDDDHQEDASEGIKGETDKKTEKPVGGNQPCGSGGPAPGKGYKRLGDSGGMRITTGSLACSGRVRVGKTKEEMQRMEIFEP